MSSRLENIRNRFEEFGVDSLLVSSPDNRRYLSDFTGTAGTLLITKNDAILATDFRYIEQAGTQSPEFKILRITGSVDWIPDLLEQLGSRNVGFESQHLSVASHNSIQTSLQKTTYGKSVGLLPVYGIVESVRILKDVSEMRALTRAIEISDKAFDEISRTLDLGQTEKEIAWKLEKLMRELGADSPSFDTIVAIGPNAALPHHTPDDSVIEYGKPLIIDMGARYEGYCSDLSRTLFVGTPDDTFATVYDTVLSAQLTAISTVQSGMTGGEADGLARIVIEEAGYGENFGHSLGHGVGLEIHEQPGIGPNSSIVLSDGMPFTIEPGIYISGWGGVRIEDVVVLENGKAKVISNASKLDSIGDKHDNKL